MKKKKVIGVIVLIIVVAIIGKITSDVYEIYSTTTSLNETDVKAVITKSMSGDVENIEILDKCEKEGYVAYLITCMQYGEEYVGCSYFEPNNILKNRYYLKGGEIVSKGELGHYSIGEIGKERIVVFGLDLPDNADKYCMDFFEQDTQVMGEIKDNKVFKLYVIEDDINNYINCNIKLLDNKYNEVKK